MLPAKCDTQYNLRTRTHNTLLIDKSADLNDMTSLFVCWTSPRINLNFSFLDLVRPISCFCQLSIKNNDDDDDHLLNRVVGKSRSAAIYVVV